MDHLNGNMENRFVFLDVFGLFVFVCLSVFFLLLLLFFFEHVVLLNEELSNLLSLVDLEKVFF